MKIARCWLVLAILCFAACNGDKKTIIIPDGAEIITINEPLDIDVEKWIVAYDTIRLETPNDDALMDGISKIQIMDNRLYIISNRSNSIYVYTDKGKFIRKISHVGQGPKEYVSLKDCFLDYINKQIIVADGFHRKVLIYDTLGNYQNFVHFNFYIDRLGCTDSGFVHFCSGSLPRKSYDKETFEYLKNYNVHFLDKNGDILYAAKNDDTPLSFDVIPYFPIVDYRNGTFLYQPVYSDTIYFVDNNSVKVKYILQTQSKFKLPDANQRQTMKYSLNSGGDTGAANLKEMKDNGYLLTWGKIMELDSLLFIEFKSKQDENVNVYYNTTANSSITIYPEQLSGNKLVRDVFKHSPCGYNNDSFYVPVSDAFIKKYILDDNRLNELPDGKLKTFLQNTDFYDTNPLLIKYSVNKKLFDKQ